MTYAVILLLVLIFASYPGWGPGEGPGGWHGWGWYPSSAFGLVLTVLIILILCKVVAL